jgi:hypothetical protein
MSRNLLVVLLLATGIAVADKKPRDKHPTGPLRRRSGRQLCVDRRKNRSQRVRRRK